MSLKALLELTRPINSLMVGFAVVVGALVASGDPRVLLDNARNLALGFATGALLSASAMVLNDIIDRDIDALNEPGRPIPSGRVNTRAAWALFAALSLLGLACSYLVGWEALVVALAAYLVGVLYNVWGKKTGLLGNLMVSYTVMTPIVYGGVLVGELGARVAIFASIIFLANTGREVTKGIVDIYGDGVRGVRTLAVTRGRRAAAYAAVAFYLSAVVLSLVPYLADMAGLVYLALVLVVDVGFVYYSWKLARHPDREVSRVVKNRVLVLMFLGLIAFGLSGV